MSLLDAAYCLDELSVGRMPDRDRLLAGAMALHTRRLLGTADQNLLDADAGLEALAFRRQVRPVGARPGERCPAGRAGSQGGRA